MASYLADNLTAPGLGVPFQEAEVISNKTDKDGHHYLKVLLLSNKKTRNNWIAPYKRIGDLPKEVIDSFIGLPVINEHSYPYFIQLKDKLERQGKSDDEIVKTLKEESHKLGLDYIDHVFMDDPNSSLLYGQQKVLDKKENEFIEKNGRPSKNFTSPGVFGTAKILDDGTEEYDMNTLRAFHLAGVDIPAFPEQEAKVKAVCSNGNSESCKKVLAVASFNSSNYPQPSSTATAEPTENVNNTCGCNKNIEMSTNQPQVTVGIDTNPNNNVPSNDTVKLIDGAKNTTAEAIQAAREEAKKVIEETNKTIKAEQQKEEEQKNKPELSQAEIDLKETKKTLEAERNEKLEMKNFFLEKMLIAAIPEENFKEKKDFIELKDATKGLINKYGMSLEDADWLIAKVSKSVPAPSSTETVEVKKETSKKSVGVAGWVGMGNTLYNSDFITRPAQKTVPKPQSNSNNQNGIEDEDYLQFLPQ